MVRRAVAGSVLAAVALLTPSAAHATNSTTVVSHRGLPANLSATPFQMLPSSAKEWMSANRGAPGCRAGRTVYAMAQLLEVVKVCL